MQQIETRILGLLKMFAVVLLHLKMSCYYPFPEKDKIEIKNWILCIHCVHKRPKRELIQQLQKKIIVIIFTSILNSLDCLLASTAPNPAGKTLTAPGKSLPLI